MSSPEAPPLLSVDNVASYLKERELVASSTTIVAQELGGGVSNVVFAISADDHKFVLKQSLPRLRVDELWMAAQERVLIEAEALSQAADLTPGGVPAVYHVDAEAFVIAIEMAPSPCETWKSHLLRGRADPSIAFRLGSLLNAWQSIELPPSNIDTFHQLRIEPYYHHVAARLPDLAAAISEYGDQLRAPSDLSFVHGDFSPKNVLVFKEAVWAIDFEVAHTGDPDFDIAFMTAHLLLKSVHVPHCRDEYLDCAEAFWSGYGRVADPNNVLGHVGCLVLARVHGKSPVGYLTDIGQRQAVSIGVQLVRDPPPTLNDAWRQLA